MENAIICKTRYSHRTAKVYRVTLALVRDRVDKVWIVERELNDLRFIEDKFTELAEANKWINHWREEFTRQGYEVEDDYVCSALRFPYTYSVPMLTERFRDVVPCH